VTSHSFVDLLVEALNLVHPRFAAGNGLAYLPDEADTPIAARKQKERAFLMELYHQFRRLWDRALPVRLGLGHVIIQADPAASLGRSPDLLFWQLGENGRPDQRLAVVSVVFASNLSAWSADLSLLARFRASHNYPLAVSVVVGREAEVAADERPATAGVIQVVFDTDRQAAMVTRMASG
jgi:hypothetical protein